ncbi:MAG: hypothetical protein KY431_06715 [Actinobacteria bacterium]|nr:hypothetical protein [Actinomycetota bacterium]
MARTSAAETRLMAEYATFTRDNIDSGELVAGEQLQRPDTPPPCGSATERRQ